jgi:hypothetical protein
MVMCKKINSGVGVNCTAIGTKERRYSNKVVVKGIVGKNIARHQGVKTRKIQMTPNRSLQEAPIW